MVGCRSQTLVLIKAMQMVCEQDQEPPIRAELTLNGQEIEFNYFVQDFIGKAVIGMIGSLRGLANAQTVTLSISKPME